jgi:hypothetical protein
VPLTASPKWAWKTTARRRDAAGASSCKRPGNPAIVFPIITLELRKGMPCHCVTAASPLRRARIFDVFPGPRTPCRGKNMIP